jgi:hypothetical protein
MKAELNVYQSKDPVHSGHPVVLPVSGGLDG